MSYALLVATDIDEVEPIDYEEVSTCRECVKWMEAMKKEMTSLQKMKLGFWLIGHKSESNRQ